MGYLPVIVKGQQFSLCMEGKDGERYRRTYELQVNLVRFAGEEPCGSRPSEVLVAKLQDGLEAPEEPEPAPAPVPQMALPNVNQSARWNSRIIENGFLGVSVAAME